jgi:hypothetical protein
MSSPLQMSWASCPTASRIVLIAYPVLSLVMTVLGRIIPFLQVLLPLCNVRAVSRGLFWALPLSICWRPIQFGPSVLFLFVELYMALSFFSVRERTMGSTTFLCWLGVCSTAISAIFIVLSFLLSLVLGGEYLVIPIHGLWPAIMMCTTLRSLGKPDENTTFWGIVQIPNKWYPLVLVAFFSLLSGRIMWDFAVAILFGFAHQRLQLDHLLVGRRWVDDWTKQWFQQAVGGDWVPIGGLQEDAMDSGESGGGSVYRHGGARGQQQPQTQAFAGPGYKLGSS